VLCGRRAADARPLEDDEELDRILALGIDGVFADDPAAAAAARARRESA
jgi:glycerophosphoryl diester phosphodiesterase